jgi:hypothetical protein
MVDSVVDFITDDDVKFAAGGGLVGLIVGILCRLFMLGF